MNREARVWIKIIMHAIFLGMHFIEITRDRVCFVYVFMTGVELNIRTIYKASMRKARAHQGHWYPFGG